MNVDATYSVIDQDTIVPFSSIRVWCLVEGRGPRGLFIVVMFEGEAYVRSESE